MRQCKLIEKDVVFDCCLSFWQSSTSKYRIMSSIDSSFASSYCEIFVFFLSSFSQVYFFFKEIDFSFFFCWDWFFIFFLIDWFFISFLIDWFFIFFLFELIFYRSFDWLIFYFSFDWLIFYFSLDWLIFYFFFDWLIFYFSFDWLIFCFFFVWVDLIWFISMLFKFVVISRSKIFKTNWVRESDFVKETNLKKAIVAESKRVIDNSSKRLLTTLIFISDDDAIFLDVNHVRLNWIWRNLSNVTFSFDLFSRHCCSVQRNIMSDDKMSIAWNAKLKKSMWLRSKIKQRKIQIRCVLIRIIHLFEKIIWKKNAT